MISKNELSHLKKLCQKKYRREFSQFLIEGTRLVDEAFRGSGEFVKVWYSPTLDSRWGNLITRFQKSSIPCIVGSDRDLKQITKTVQNQGIAALLKLLDEPDIKDGKEENWLYLDQIGDPGNLGTILRTACWFGINRIALSINCVDPYNSKVVRSGMGAHFQINIHKEINLGKIKSLGHKIIAADQNGSPITKQETVGGKWCLVMGSEAHGISSEIKPLIDQFVSIPGSGKAESLNVAVAAGILMNQLT